MCWTSCAPAATTARRRQPRADFRSPESVERPSTRLAIAPRMCAMAGPELVPQRGVGVSDDFQRMWTPHRMAYIQREKDPAAEPACPFCSVPALGDEEGLL